MADPALRTLADDYWDAVLEAAPTYATFVGDHRFDDRIEDVSAEGEQRQRGVWAGLQRRLDALDRAGFDAADHITAGLMAAELQMAVDRIDHRMSEQAWDQMEGVHCGLLLSTPHLTAPEPAHAEALLARFGQVPTLLDQAVARFHEALAADRRPPRVVIERSLHMIDGYLASPIDEDPFTLLRGPEGWAGEEAWRAALRRNAEDVVRPAFARYRAALADDLLRVVRPDDRSGLQWIAGGTELYRMLVHHHTSLELSPEELHQFGLDEVARLREEYAEVGGRLFGTSVQSEIFERLAADPALRYATPDEIMDDSRRCFGAASALVGEWFGRLPVAECVIEPVPDYAAPDSPAAYYFPPAPDGSRPGTYFVNTYEPAGKPRYETASVAYHEAIPGHHLQLALASELDDLPDFQRLSMGHTAYAEGWGLYSERLADEMGLYADDLELLGLSSGDSLRSCRLVVDTGLHALGWSRQRAIDFMVENVPTSRQEIEVEVDRYIAMPAQALAYKVGQREIFRLRDRARESLGDAFDIRGFHDTVLGSSLVTLPLLGDLVDGWVAAVGAG